MTDIIGTCKTRIKMIPYDLFNISIFITIT